MEVIHVTPVKNRGFGQTFDAHDLNGNHLVVSSLSPENRRPHVSC